MGVDAEGKASLYIFDHNVAEALGQPTTLARIPCRNLREVSCGNFAYVVFMTNLVSRLSPLTKSLQLRILVGNPLLRMVQVGR
jgi:hypothetical protein